MWPFITCGRSLSVMISLHSKPDLGKGNTTFTPVSRKLTFKKVYSILKNIAHRKLVMEECATSTDCEVAYVKIFFFKY